MAPMGDRTSFSHQYDLKLHGEFRLYPKIGAILRSAIGDQPWDLGTYFQTTNVVETMS
jgi:hypothetical protein